MTNVQDGRRTAAIAFAVIAAAALTVFGPPLAKNEVFTFRDHSDYFAPMRFFTIVHLRAGKLPLWNPYNGSGEQWLANPQTAVFYPPAWIFLLVPFAAAFILYLFIHALVLGLGAYRLLRMRAGPEASLVGSVALMLCGPVLSLIDVENNFTTFAWVPWIVWCGLRDRDREGQPRLAAALLALAFLGGEPFYASIAALLYCVAVRRPVKIAIAGAGAMAIAAIQLFPFLDLVEASDRFGRFTADDILRNSMTHRDWMRLVVPPLFERSSPLSTQQFIFVVYGGLLVFVLAAAGLVVMWRRSAAAAAGWLALLVVSAVIASGPAFLLALPLTIFRYPSRVLPFAMLAVIVFAVAGWEMIRRGSGIVDALLIICIVADFRFAARPLLGTAREFATPIPYPQSIGRGAKFIQLYGDNPLRAGSRNAWISGYQNLRELRFTASTPAPLSPRPYTDLYRASLNDLPLLAETGVAWILAPAEERVPFREVARVENVVTYRLPGALPMAYVRTRDGKILPPRALNLDASLGRVSVTTPAGGLLVLTQNDARGWRVSIDGHAAEKKLVRGTFRAVDVPPGKHEILWEFRPLSLPAGACVSALALLWLASGLLKKKSR